MIQCLQTIYDMQSRTTYLSLLLLVFFQALDMEMQSYRDVCCALTD
jgi:hypothetical protein